MLFLLQVPGFILVGWMEDLFPFVSEETISFPAPPPHSLEIHIKQLQVNTCKRMPKSQSRIRGCCQVWIPQTQYAGFWVHVWKTTKERTGWFTKWVTKSFRNFKIPGIFKVLTFFFFFPQQYQNLWLEPSYKFCITTKRSSASCKMVASTSLRGSYASALIAKPVPQLHDGRLWACNTFSSLLKLIACHLQSIN